MKPDQSRVRVHLPSLEHPLAGIRFFIVGNNLVRATTSSPCQNPPKASKAFNQNKSTIARSPRGPHIFGSATDVIVLVAHLRYETIMTGYSVQTSGPMGSAKIAVAFLTGDRLSRLKLSMRALCLSLSAAKISLRHIRVIFPFYLTRKYLHVSGFDSMVVGEAIPPSPVRGASIRTGPC